MTTKTLATLSLALALGITNSFAQTATKAPQQDTAAQKIFRFVEQQAEPKGGQEAFQRYLTEQVLYPKIARDSNIQGRVVLQFIVNENGRLSDFRIIKEIGGGCGEAVKKALEKYPYLWTPGKTNGKPVKSYFVVPFTFRLQ